MHWHGVITAAHIDSLRSWISWASGEVDSTRRGDEPCYSPQSGNTQWKLGSSRCNIVFGTVLKWIVDETWYQVIDFGSRSCVCKKPKCNTRPEEKLVAYFKGISIKIHKKYLKYNEMRGYLSLERIWAMITRVHIWSSSMLSVVYTLIWLVPAIHISQSKSNRYFIFLSHFQISDSAANTTICKIW